MGLSVHLHGLVTNGQNGIGSTIQSDDGWGVHDYFVVVDDQRIRRTEVDGDVVGEEVK